MAVILSASGAAGASPALLGGFEIRRAKCRRRRHGFRVRTDGSEDGFPSFLPKEVHGIRDPFARKLAARIQRLPVQVTSPERLIMSSCVKPLIQSRMMPVVLLHGFDRLAPYV